MAEGNGGTSIVAVIAIVVLVIIVAVFLIYFLGFRTQTPIIEKPSFNIEAPKVPGTRTKTQNR